MIGQVEACKDTDRDISVTIGLKTGNMTGRIPVYTRGGFGALRISTAPSLDATRFGKLSTLLFSRFGKRIVLDQSLECL